MAAKRTPTQVVIDKHFSEFAAEQYPGRDIDEVFEIYVATQLLKRYNLSDEERDSGLVDGTKDGGIDGVFIFFNGTLVQADHPALDADQTRAQGRNPEITVIITQSKNSGGWKELGWDRLNSNLRIMLDPAKTETELADMFRPEVVERIGYFRRLTEIHGTSFPTISFTVQYTTLGSEAKISKLFKEKASQLRDLIAALLTPGASVVVDHVGVETLYKLAGKAYSEPAKLEMRQVLRELDSYIGVATIESYLAFARDEDGELRDELFDSNVRDFEGENSVNKSIRATVEAEEGAEFWWQNNGVTVLAAQVHAPQQILTIDQPLIVNGLQTTHVLHMAAKAGKIPDARLQQGILVRVIEATDEVVRDAVIGGTNRQTKVSTPSLFASAELQRDLERFFHANGWYYERRKNQYRNQGKPANRRVSINQLAQASISLLLGLPDDARARPTSILARAKNGYDAVFSDAISPDAYLKGVILLAKVTDFLRTPAAKEIRDDFSNVRFYVLVGAAMRAVGATDFDSLQFTKNFNRMAKITDNDLASTLQRLEEIWEFFHSEYPQWGRDALFKNSEFRRFFLANIGHDEPVAFVIDVEDAGEGEREAQ